jgi:hypothetical protein
MFALTDTHHQRQSVLQPMMQALDSQLAAAHHQVLALCIKPFLFFDFSCLHTFTTSPEVCFARVSRFELLFFVLFSAHPA